MEGADFGNGFVTGNTSGCLNSLALKRGKALLGTSEKPPTSISRQA